MTDEKITQMPTYLQPELFDIDDELYEYVSYAGELTAKELKILNLHGYVYQSELLEVDFDYEDEYGKYHTGYQDIYYFTRIKL